MPLALNGNPSHESPPFSQLGNSLEVLGPVLSAKFVIFARIVVALVGTGFKPVLQKCLFSVPFFLAWEHERRTLAGAVACIAFQSQPEYVVGQIRKKLEGEIYAAYRMGFSKPTPGYSKRRPAKRAILRRYRIRKSPQGSGRVSKP